MRYHDPFAQPGQWYRGNTHTHTTHSDGVCSVSDCCRGYKEQGYDFLVISDHNRVINVSRYSDDSFLTVTGSELHPANPYGGTKYHIVALGIHEEIEGENRHPNEIIADVAKQGGISVLAHPYYSGHTLLDLLPLNGYFAVEVFNTTCHKTGRAFSESHWDDLLDRSGPVYGIASDDAHFLHDMYQGWVMVKSPELTVDSILGSLRQGLFYSTQGPEIVDFHIENASGEKRADSPKRVIAKFSPAVSVVFKSAPCRGKQIRAQEHQLITEAFFDLSGNETYVRLEITAPDGKKAWSQPITFTSE